jgi:acyl carrier protein
MLDASTIRNAARETASKIAGRSISDGERLISSGLIDSLSILKLIGNLEKKLQVEIPTNSLQPDDFDDLQLIVETVQRVARPSAD